MMRQFFIRRFCKYLFCMMLPTIVIFAVSLIFTGKQVDKELRLQAGNSLKSVNVNLNSVLNNIIYQNDFLTSNPGIHGALRRILGGEVIPYGDAISMRNLVAMLRSTMQTNSYIDSVYIYLEGYDKFLTSDRGIVEIAEYPDQNWKLFYDRMLEEEQNAVCTRTVENDVLGEEKKLITVYQRFLLQKGGIVMNIGVEPYQKTLDGVFPQHYETLYFFDQQGNLLLSYGQEKELGNGELSAIFQKNRKDGSSDGEWVEVNGETYLYNEISNERFQIHIVSLIPLYVWKNGLGQTVGLFAVIMLLNLCFTALVAYTTTARNFRQIDYMVRVFNDAENGIYPSEPRHTMQDEYDVIMNNIIYMFLQAVQLNNTLKEKETEAEKAKLAALQMQINPHFLYNTLQGVEFQIQKVSGRENEGVRMLKKLSDILKYSLEDPTSMVSLSEEIQYLKRYVEIQTYRFGSRFIVYYEIDEALKDAQVFRLLLQPLVENSLLHGLRGLDRRGYVKIKALRRGEEILFSVLDNGCGMERAEIQALYARMKDPKSSHVGICNINSRLILQYGETSALHILSKKGVGCVVKFRIPCVFPEGAENEKKTNQEEFL